MLLFSGTVSFGQSLEEINKMLNNGQNKKAKDGIDKFLSDSKNAAKPDGWYSKARAYNAVSKDSSLAATDAMKLKNESLEAFKKYQQLDSKEVSLVIEQYGSFFDLFNGHYNIGVIEFNNKNFAVSFEAFKNALMVEDFVKSKGYDYNGFKYPVLDTSLIINIAVAANMAKDEASAVFYYKKLADANLTSEQYINIYEYLVEYYIKNKDEANLKAVLDKGRTLYPDNEYWVDVEIDLVAKTGNKEALFAKYEDLMKRYPAKYTYPYFLSVEMYNELYTADKRPANLDAFKNKLTELLKNAINLDKGIDAKMLMTRHLYNSAVEYQDSSKSFKGPKPEDLKKRDAYKALFLKKVDECIPYGESVIGYFGALPALKPIQKANYKIALDILAQLYSNKGDVKKSAEYDKKITEVEKM